MSKSVNVDFILNNWFGEPPEHSNNERTLIRHLYEPLREIERQRDALLGLLKEARTIIRASSSRNLVKDWDQRTTDAMKEMEKRK